MILRNYPTYTSRQQNMNVFHVPTTASTLFMHERRNHQQANISSSVRVRKKERVWCAKLTSGPIPPFWPWFQKAWVSLVETMDRQ